MMCVDFFLYMYMYVYCIWAWNAVICSIRLYTQERGLGRICNLRRYMTFSLSVVFGSITLYLDDDVF